MTDSMSSQLQAEAKEKYITNVKKGVSDYVDAVTKATGSTLASNYVKALKEKGGADRYEKNVAKPETRVAYFSGLSRFVGAPIRAELATKFARNVVEKGIPKYKDYVATEIESRAQQMGEKWDTKKSQFIENYRKYAENPNGEKWLTRFIAAVKSTTAMG